MGVNLQTLFPITENAYLWFLQLGITRKMSTSPKGMNIHRRLPATRVGERIEKKYRLKAKERKWDQKKNKKNKKRERVKENGKENCEKSLYKQ